MIYDLPKTVMVAGEEYAVRSDFREILDVMEILNDVKLLKQERFFLTLLFFYQEFDKIPPEHYEEAVEQCFWFINGGRSEESSVKQPRLMDWEQDFQYIISPVNRVIGHEIRADDYLHWWTFLAAYMEIGECTFAQIVHIRDMRSKGKPLDKADQEWYRRNQRLVDLKQEISDVEEDTLKMWGGA